MVLSTHHEDARLDVLRCGEALSAVLLECTVVGLATCTLTHMTELASSREIVRELTGQRGTPQLLIRIGEASDTAADSPLLRVRDWPTYSSSGQLQAGRSEPMSRYRDLYEKSLNDPAAFWREAAREVTWTRPPQQILDDSRPPFYRWFPDAELNTCANALDRHVDAGRGDQAALIYDSPVTDTKRTYSYAELLDVTSRFAGALRELGVRQG